MITVNDVYEYIDSFAPFSSALSFDNVGTLVGDRNSNVKKIVCALDITKDAVEFSEKVGAELIVSHHPVIFDPLKSVCSDNVVYSLCRKGINAICAHTNLDAAPGGVNDVLCSLLDLKNVEAFEPENIARIGDTQDGSLAQLLNTALIKLGLTNVNYVDCGKTPKKIAVIGGSGGGYIDEVISAGADTLITGEMKHNQFIEAKAKGLNVIVAGHFETEYPVIPVLADKLTKQFEAVEVHIFCEPAYNVFSR